MPILYTLSGSTTPPIDDSEEVLYSMTAPSTSTSTSTSISTSSATAPSPTPHDADLSISPVSSVSYAPGPLYTLSGPPPHEQQEEQQEQLQEQLQEEQQQQQEQLHLEPQILQQQIQQQQQQEQLHIQQLHALGLHLNALHQYGYPAPVLPTVYPHLPDGLAQQSLHPTNGSQLMALTGPGGIAFTFMTGSPTAGGIMATGHVSAYSAHSAPSAPSAPSAISAPPPAPHSQTPALVAPPAPTMAVAIPVNTAINVYGIDTSMQNLFPLDATNPFVPHNGPANLAPSNDNLKRFLQTWAHDTARDRPVPLDREAIMDQISLPACVVRPSDVDGDHCDMQGVNWHAMGTTLADARRRRERTYRNYTSIPHSDCWFPQRSERMMPPSKEHYFDFQQTHIRKNIRVPHFQLRNLLATASRSRAYFPGSRRGTVTHYDMITGETSTALRFPSEWSDVQVSTLAAGHGVLVAGGFGGEYCVANLDAEYVDENVSEKTRCAGSVTTQSESGICNHIQVHRMRNVGGPVATFSSNDQALRILDVATNKILYDVRFNVPLNCSAISPDGRLRVVMGDTMAAYIVPATPDRLTSLGADGVHRQPDILQSLWGHQDFGFSCAWADDGYTLATGSQDRAVKIWDARRWCSSSGKPEPVVTLRTQMAGARSLHFSPAGSGKRLLIAAEESDVISVIDAQTFAARQSIEFFGEIAGVSQTANGQNLVALCADSSRGGLLQFERNRSWQAEAAAWHDEGPCHHHGRGDPRWPTVNTFDWKWCGIGTGHGTDVSPAAHARRLRVAAKRMRSAAAAHSYSAHAPPPLNDVFDEF